MAGEDDYDSIITRFIGERKAQFMGRLQTFYLFKISVGFSSGEEDSLVSHLGIAGPYTAGSTHLITSSDASAIHWEEEYDAAKLDEQFKKLLQSSEDALKKQPKKE